MKLPEPNDVFNGRYLVEARLGEGGFATVFRAIDQTSQRPVALKILKPSATGYDVTTASRFLREARAIAGLQDRYTLTLFDFGRTESGLLFMVCELVEGEDLADIIASRRLGEAEVVRILLQVLSSMREAHQAGILHRDIKPANIRIQAATGEVRVLDFGLAKSIEGNERSLTATGHAIGTPRYMSPEQLIGDELTPATDIYSLGVTAIEALLGREAIMPGRSHELAAGALVDEHLRTVLNRMVAPQAALRYASTDEVARDLTTPATPLAAQQSSNPPSPRRRDLPPISDRADWQTWGVLGFAIVVLGGAAVLWGRHLMRDSEPVPKVVASSADSVPTPTTTSADEPDEPDASDLLMPSQMAPCEREPPVDGLRELRLVKGLTRHSMPLYLPPGTARGEKLPVVFFNAEPRLRSTKAIPYLARFEELADQHHALLVPFDAEAGAAGIAKQLAEISTGLCVDDRRVYAVFVARPAGSDKDVHPAGPLAKTLGEMCDDLSGLATVNSRHDLAACPKLPAIHLSPRDDFRLPVREPPKPGRTYHSKADIVNGKLKKLNLLPVWQQKANMEVVRREAYGRCAEEEPMLSVVVEGWRSARECTGRSAPMSELCTIWDCTAPLAVCEIPGAAVWTVDSSRCASEEPTPGFPGAADIWAFFGIAPIDSSAGDSSAGGSDEVDGG